MTRLEQPLDASLKGRDADSLDKTLRKLVVGQDEVVDQLVLAYQMYLSGLSAPGRPLMNFLFLGPTGSGKTKTVEAMADAIIGNPRAMLKIDCAEFQHSHEIAKLIGSPPGYLGHRETPAILSQAALDQFHTGEKKISFVLFDEIEKASDAVWNLLLGILDKATLRLGNGVTTDFSRCMIFMTSNLGAVDLGKIMPGFQIARLATAIADKDQAMLERKGMEAARRKFTPEFINRLDRIMVFKTLGQPELRRILDLELRYVQNRILNQAVFIFTVTEAGKELLLSLGTDLKYGARQLKRVIERLLVEPLANLMATGQVENGDWVEAGLSPSGDSLSFSKAGEDLLITEMGDLINPPSTAAVACAS